MGNIMKEPPWYKYSERWLLKRGKPVIAFGLAAQVGIAGYLLYRLVVLNKGAVESAAWVVYMWMP